MHSLPNFKLTSCKASRQHCLEMVISKPLVCLHDALFARGIIWALSSAGASSGAAAGSGSLPFRARMVEAGSVSKQTFSFGAVSKETLAQFPRRGSSWNETDGA